MSATPTVSVIVPIYNVEQYLEECLDSIIGQTLESLEIICINDGSTDNSLGILRRYEQQDGRIIVIDKENGGYGKAVNTGLDHATGEWIAIVEPDDFIDAHMYEDLVNESRLENGGTADIVKSGYWNYFYLNDGFDPYIERPLLNDHMRVCRYEFNVYDDPEVLLYHPSIWSAIYRHSFIKANGIRMVEPKGAGWADNPWLYETMLQASQIVWTPAAYYYYRQANPNGSSNVGDYRIPFDRLREIREIYKRMNVTNKGLLTALCKRTAVYCRVTLFEEADYPEADPEIQNLIREAFSAINEDLLLAAKNGISAEEKEYYRDFMGIKLQEVKPRAASESPTFSIVIPIKDDRSGLWKTVDSLLKQTETEFEVVFVDCMSRDRGPAIVRDIAQRDGRFKLLEEPSGNIGDGFNHGLQNASGSYVMFARLGVVLMEPDYLSRLKSATLQQDAGKIDVLVGSLMLKRFRERRLDGDPECRIVECDANPEYVAANLEPSVYGKAFLRENLVEHKVSFAVEGDEDGYAFNVAAMSHIKKAALVSNLEARTFSRRKILRNDLEYERDLVKMHETRFSAMAQAAQNDGSEEAWRVARGCIVRTMRSALDEKGLAHSGQALYDILKDIYENKYGITAVPKTTYQNMFDLQYLERGFSTSYERYCRMETDKRRKRFETLETKRDALQRKTAKLQGNVKAAKEKNRQLENAGAKKLKRGAAKVFRSITPGKKS